MTTGRLEPKVGPFFFCLFLFYFSTNSYLQVCVYGHHHHCTQLPQRQRGGLRPKCLNPQVVFLNSDFFIFITLLTVTCRLACTAATTIAPKCPTTTRGPETIYVLSPRQFVLFHYSTDGYLQAFTCMAVTIAPKCRNDNRGLETHQVSGPRYVFLTLIFLFVN